MSLNLSGRVPRPTNNPSVQRIWVWTRKAVAILVLMGLMFTTIPIASSQSLIRIAQNLALPSQSASKLHPTTRALLQGNSQNRGMPPLPVNAPGVTPGRLQSKQEKEAKVQNVKINPHDEVTLQLGQQAVFSAVPL